MISGHTQFLEFSEAIGKEGCRLTRAELWNMLADRIEGLGIGSTFGR